MKYIDTNNQFTSVDTVKKLASFGTEKRLKYHTKALWFVLHLLGLVVRVCDNENKTKFYISKSVLQKQLGLQKGFKSSDINKLVAAVKNAARAPLKVAPMPPKEPAQRAADEAAKKAEAQRIADEAAKKAEAQKVADEAAKKAAEEASAKAKTDEEAKRAEAQRVADEAAKKAAEDASAKAKTDETAKKAEAQRIADEEAKRAEAQKVADEAAKKAAEEASAKAKADEEAKIAEAQRIADEAAKKAAEEASAKAKADEEAIRAEAQRIIADEEAQRVADEKAAEATRQALAAKEAEVEIAEGIALPKALLEILDNLPTKCDIIQLTAEYLKENLQGARVDYYKPKDLIVLTSKGERIILIPKLRFGRAVFISNNVLDQLDQMRPLGVFKFLTICYNQPGNLNTTPLSPLGQYENIPLDYNPVTRSPFNLDKLLLSLPHYVR